MGCLEWDSFLTKAKVIRVLIKKSTVARLQRWWTSAIVILSILVAETPLQNRMEVRDSVPRPADSVVGVSFGIGDEL